MRKPAHLGVKLLCFGGCAAFLLLWVCLDLPCVFRHITGVICPGCGMSRAWLSALRLELGTALRYHPVFWSLPVFAFYILYDGRLFSNSRLNYGVLFGILGGFVLCYCIRLIVFLDGGLAI